MQFENFGNLALSEEVLRAVNTIGYEQTTDIQQQAIPAILQGRDVIGQSQTGTGKTAAFGIPALELVGPENRAPQILILCPTRELAVQVAGEIRRFAMYQHSIKVAAIYGGAAMEGQIRDLKSGAQIVVGTPGRVMDHMRRKTLKLGQIKMVVLDEADEMLNMGFREDIETILMDAPQQRQTVLFSATMPKAILEIAEHYQTDPLHIQVAAKHMTVEEIDQYYCTLPQDRRIDAIIRLNAFYQPKLSLVFCNTKRMVDEVVSALQKRGIPANGIHGDISQQTRSHVMQSFKNGGVGMLVATDVAARGIDVQDVEIVYNYDAPQDDEYYVHRIGRTGRAGRKGKAFTFLCAKRQMDWLNAIQRYTGARIGFHAIPTDQDISARREQHFMEHIQELASQEDAGYYQAAIERLCEGGRTPAEIAGALLKLVRQQSPKADLGKDGGFELANRSGGKYGKARNPRAPHPAGGFRNQGATEMQRLFLNVGKRDRVKPADIVGAIAGESGVRGSRIGKIEMLKHFSFVEVAKQDVPQILKSMKQADIKGIRVSLEPAKCGK